MELRSFFMSFIKMLPRLASLKYFPLVLSLILIIPFTPLEIPTIYGGDYINRISIPYRQGGVKALSFLTGVYTASHNPIFPLSQMPGQPPIMLTPQMAGTPIMEPQN
jgi:hypothetical protein